MKHTSLARPKLSLKSCLILCDIDRYIRTYKVRGENLESAASDVLDGAVFRHEIEELIRKRLLTIVRYMPRELPDEGPEYDYTVHLSERAMLTFWPQLGAHPQRRNEKWRSIKRSR